jgi:hypothetical protein
MVGDFYFIQKEQKSLVIKNKFVSLHLYMTLPCFQYNLNTEYEEGNNHVDGGPAGGSVRHPYTRRESRP